MKIEQIKKAEQSLCEIQYLKEKIKLWERFCAFESIELNYTKDGKPNQSFTLRDDNLKKLIDAKAVKEQILSDLKTKLKKFEIEFESL